MSVKPQVLNGLAILCSGEKMKSVSISSKGDEKIEEKHLHCVNCNSMYFNLIEILSEIIYV